MCSAFSCDVWKVGCETMIDNRSFILSPPGKPPSTLTANYMRLDYMQLSGLALPPPGRPLHTNAERKVAHDITRLRLARDVISKKLLDWAGEATYPPLKTGPGSQRQRKFGNNPRELCNLVTPFLHPGSKACVL